MKKCLNCGSLNSIDISLMGEGMVLTKRSGNFFDYFKGLPVNGFACTACGHVHLFADVETLRKWAQKG